MDTIKKIRTTKLSLLFLILYSIINLGCQKFVDIKKISSQNLVETTSDCRLLLDNYDVMNKSYPSDGESSADDYYLNDAGYLSTTLDQSDRDFYIWARTAIRQSASTQWQAAYNVIFNANVVLETLEKINDGTELSLKNSLKGEALFFRAFSLWQLSQIYCKPYSATTSSNDLGLPLRTNSDINDKSTRASVQATYFQIIDDLKQSIELLPVNVPVLSRPNKAAAYAMLARTYLSMSDYQNALTFSNTALEINKQLLDFNTLSISSNTPFTRFNKEVLFHSVMIPNPSLVPLLSNINIAKIDPEIVNSYLDGDLRKQILLKSNTGVDAGSFRFSGNYEPVTSSILFNGLAVDELYLIRAECYARSNNVTLAMTDLNTLLKSRWLSNTFVDLTAESSDDALRKVIKERRKELLMRGIRWSDLRRLNNDNRFAKTLTRTVQGITYTLPANDLRYTLLIPQQVLDFSNIQQNPR